MIEKIGTVIPKQLPPQPTEEVVKRTDFSWFNSTLSTIDSSQAYGANPDRVNDIIFSKVGLEHGTINNGEKQAEARGEKSIPVVKSNKDVGAQENQLEKEQLAVLEEYIKNRLDQIYNTSSHLKGKRVQEKYIREQILDLKKELNEHEKKSTVLKWLDRIFTGGLVIAGIGSVILSAVTYGAAIPMVVFFANAALAFGSGTTKIISAVNQHQADKRIGKLLELGEDRKILNTISSEDIDELREINDKEMQAHKQKKKEQEKKEETSRSINDNKRGG